MFACIKVEFRNFSVFSHFLNFLQLLLKLPLQTAPVSWSSGSAFIPHALLCNKVCMIWSSKITWCLIRTGKRGVLQSTGSQSWTQLSGWTELTKEKHTVTFLLIFFPLVFDTMVEKLNSTSLPGPLNEMRSYRTPPRYLNMYLCCLEISAFSLVDDSNFATFWENSVFYTLNKVPLYCWEITPHRMLTASTCFVSRGTGSFGSGITFPGYLHSEQP